VLQRMMTILGQVSLPIVFSSNSAFFTQHGCVLKSESCVVKCHYLAPLFSCEFNSPGGIFLGGSHQMTC
jgi:hypothetical protein